MTLSDEKVTHLAHLIAKNLANSPEISMKTSEPGLLLEVKKIMARELKFYAELDTFTRNKIKTFSRNIPEGSREWEVMYQKIFGEEVEKKSRRL